jgi:hypothetical protein
MKFLIAWMFITFARNLGCFGIVLNCNFQDFQNYWDEQSNYGTRYTCVVNNLRTSLQDRKVTGVAGVHLNGKTNSDVKQVFISEQNCPYLPLDLGYKFNNLEVFYAMRSKVEELTGDELNGMNKLKIFDVSHNLITNLTANFFKGHKTIEIISFYECRLRFVEEGALDHLVNLQQGHFDLNKCINYRGDTPSKIETLKREIKKCNAAPSFSLSGSVFALMVLLIMKISNGFC